MRRGVAILTAAVLAAGCKSTGKKDPAAAAPASAANARGKDGRTPAWLADMNRMPGAGTDVPKADSWGDPRDPATDIAAEVKGLIAGLVLAPDGSPARNVYIQIEPADTGTSAARPAPIGILADAQGTFLTKGLQPGRAYTLTAQAKVDGRSLIGVVQTRPPKPNVLIRLRDDMPPAPAAAAAPPPGVSPPPGVPSFPPPAASVPSPAARATPPAGGYGPAAPRTSAPPARARVPDSDLPPPADLTPSGTDGAWTPGGGPAPALRSVVPPAGGFPDAAPAVRPARPENTAVDTANPWRPPTANIPPPPATVTPPPTITPPPPPAEPDRRQSRSVQPGSDFALVDTRGQRWDFGGSRSGDLVLLDFLTTSCLPCKKAIPVLTDLQSRYGSAGLEVVGVVCDTTGTRERAALAGQYQREKGLNYALYVEPGEEPGRVQARFKVRSYPTLVLLDANGTVLWRGHPNDRNDLEMAIRQNLSGGR